MDYPLSVREYSISFNALCRVSLKVQSMLLVAAVLMTSGAVITRPVANMYSGPSEDKDVVSQAIYGANVGVVEDTGDWVRIRTADDYTGWVAGSSLLRGSSYAQSGKVAEVQNLY